MHTTTTYTSKRRLGFRVAGSRMRERGFTLMEILVAAAIIGLSASLIFLNAGTGKKEQALQRAAQRLALDIREAQNKSLAPSDTPICIYGLRVSSSAGYFFYQDADCDTGMTYDSVSSAAEPAITLESGITITNGANQEVAFQSPEPITYLNGNKNDPPITITLTNGLTSKDVIINRFGQVEIR